MADKITKEHRSWTMSQVKSRDTKPELIVRRFLHSRGFRYRLHDRMLPGKPDVKLSKYNTLIFINGCFWHGHKTCSSYSGPKTNKAFWSNKILANQRRDVKNNFKAKQLGWNIITIWECELRSGVKEKTLNELVQRIIEP
jgi:DNA mismatch endonuclease (patch repair protein)